MATLFPVARVAEAMQAHAPRDTAPAADAANSQLSPEEQARLAQLQADLKSAIAARDARAVAKTQNQMGELWLGAGNAQNALAAYNRAAAAANLVKDAEQGVAALNGLGNVAIKSGQAQEAMQAFQQALAIASMQGITGGKADALNGLAILSASQRQAGVLSITRTRLWRFGGRWATTREKPLSLRRLQPAITLRETKPPRSNMRNRRTMLFRRRVIERARPMRCSESATSTPASETKGH